MSLMILNLTSTIFFIMLGTPTLLIIIFLPALLELRKPRDAGPRIIMEEFHTRLLGSKGIPVMGNLEEECRLDPSLLPQLLKIIEFLPCLEA